MKRLVFPSNVTYTNPYRNQKKFSFHRINGHRESSNSSWFGLICAGLLATGILTYSFSNAHPTEAKEPDNSRQNSPIMVRKVDVTHESSLVEGTTSSPSSSDTDMSLFTAQANTIIELVSFWALWLITCGIGYPFFSPIWDFYQIKRTFNDLKFEDTKFEFLGDLKTFYLLRWKNFLYSCFSFGVYYFLGFSDSSRAKYIDEHTRRVPENGLVSEKICYAKPFDQYSTDILLLNNHLVNK